MIPTREFNGWLKQVNPVDLTPIQSLAIKLLFPHLAPPDKDAVDRNVKEQRKTNLATHVLPVYVNDRRFAGDFTLGPQRYFTLAHGPDGNDYGTLGSELAAYFDNSKGQIEMQDFVTEEIAAKEGIPFQKQSILVKIYGTAGSNAIVARLNANVVWIPYRVEQVSIPEVIDLRFPDVQEWFWNEFNDIHAYVAQELNKTRKPGFDAMEINHTKFSRPTSFFEMLPILMDPTRGGNKVTEHIAQRLRLQNISALIYPSARIRSGVVWREDSMVRSPGWNLVDYRELKDQFMEGLNIFIGQDPWTSEYTNHFKLEKSNNGSWMMFPPRGVWRYPSKLVSDDDLRVRYRAGINVFTELIYLALPISKAENIPFLNAILEVCKTPNGKEILSYMGIISFQEFSPITSDRSERAILFNCSVISDGENYSSKGFACLETLPVITYQSLDIEPEHYTKGKPIFCEVDEGMYLYYLRS